LFKVCHKVTNFDKRLHHLLEDMIDTLEDSGGVGLAAPQIGIMRRVAVVSHTLQISSARRRRFLW
ncbi:MAG: peptide deformylase, partial [Tidjanibacter sp.]|nr:peptide deformylase [Tidjanibacter sp.]